MSAVLLALATAVVVWPAGRSAGGRRISLASPRWNGRRWSGALLGRLPPPVAGCAVTATGALITTPLVAALAGLLAALAVRSWAATRRAEATRATVPDLAEALGVLAAELRSGRSLRAATDTAVAACGDPGVAGDLAAAVHRAAGGHLVDVPAPGRPGPAGQALDRIAAAVRLSTRTGCSLAAVLGAVEEDLRARCRDEQQLRAATAGPRASAALLAGLPLLALAMGSGVGARPWHVLTGTPAGQLLLLVGVALEVAGIAWSGRLIRRTLR